MRADGRRNFNVKGKNQITRREFLHLAGRTAAGAALAPWLSPATSAWAQSLAGTGLSLPCAAGDVTADADLPAAQGGVAPGTVRRK